MTRPQPQNPTSLTAPDVYGAVFDFINAFVVDPPLDVILRGDQNRSALPSGTNDYAVMTVISEARRGSSVKTLSDNSLTIQKLVLCDVQIDIRSDDGPRAQNAASLIELWARDEFGIRFFKNYSISVTGATSPQDLTFVDESNQFVKRFMVTLNLEYWVSTSIEAPSFETVSIKQNDPVVAPENYFENVDVHHPPTED